jgi:nucleotide-binding universal stress UspA family protein
MAAVQFDRIAVATDGSPHAERALDLAIDLAHRYSSSLTVLSVAPLVPTYIGSTEAWVPTEIPDTEIQHYRGLVEKAVARAKAAGLSAVAGVCLEGVVVDEIVGYLEQTPADLLVLGSRGLSAGRRLLLGSVSDAIVHHAKCPVLVVRVDAPPAK